MTSCASCGHENAANAPYCQACGAALAQSGGGDDDVLSLMLGHVCPSCESYNDPGVAACVMCGTALADDGGAAAPAPITTTSAPAPAADAPAPAPASGASWMQAPAGAPLATAHAMPAVSLDALKQGGKQLEAPTGSPPSMPRVPAPVPELATPASTTTCPNCQAKAGAGAKFCASCGHRLDGAPSTTPTAAPPSPVGTVMMSALAAPAKAGAPANATMVMPALQSKPAPNVHVDRGAPPPSATMFFGAATVERHARLILIKGHTQFGTQWRLQAGTTVVGREQGMVLFPDDGFLAPAHCQLEFKGESLFLTPLPSTNGVFVRLTVKEEVGFGAELSLGLERLRLKDPSALERVHDGGATADGTKHQGSVVRDGDPLVLERVVADGAPGEVYFRPQRVVTIGRSLCDVNFATDPYLSTRHAQVTRTARGAFVEDLGSRNGTFLRVTTSRQLQHGDIVLMGEQVLRIELSLTLPRIGPA